MADISMTSDEQPDPRKRILIVDDHADNARMMKVLLKRQGYDVIIALDGRAAIDVATAIRPAVILMDLTLPGLSGLEAAEELRRTDGFAETIIVAVSGHAADRLPQPSPFDSHLTKPVNYELLIKLLADATINHAANG